MSAKNLKRHRRLGEKLVQAGKINSEQLTKALEEQQIEGRNLGRILVEAGLLQDDVLNEFLPKQVARERMLAIREHQSFDSTEFFRLQTALKFTLFSDDPIKTLLIGSAIPGEGKTTCASYFARALAAVQTGPYLLVDADLFNPTLHRRFDVQPSPGWTDCLVNGHTVDDCLARTDMDNLRVLPAGTLPPNPAALFASKKMQELIDRLKETFDLIIFDSTPLIASPTAAILASKLDAAIMVVNAGHTKRKLVKKSISMLNETKIKILGVVLNRVVDHHGSKHGYGSGYRSRRK